MPEARYRGGMAARTSYPAQLVRNSLRTFRDPRRAWQVGLLPAKYVAALKAAGFESAHLAEATSFANRDDLLRDSLRRAPATGLVLEFGVFRGTSTNVLADAGRGRSDPRVFGFDSFAGLPEDWEIGVARGSFAVGTLPTVRENVTLVRGLFQDTLEPFLSEHPGPAAFVHVDSDLYSSAAYVLGTLDRAGRIRAGTVIQFDEYVNHPHWWTDGEYRAFQEFARERRLPYRYVAYAAGGEAVVVEVRGPTPESG